MANYAMNLNKFEAAKTVAEKYEAMEGYTYIEMPTKVDTISKMWKLSELLKDVDTSIKVLDLFKNGHFLYRDINVKVDVEHNPLADTNLTIKLRANWEVKIEINVNERIQDDLEYEYAEQAEDFQGELIDYLIGIFIGSSWDVQVGIILRSLENFKEDVENQIDFLNSEV
jgi:hypothetical protein